MNMYNANMTSDPWLKEAYSGISGIIVQPIFMHNPIGFLSMWGSAFVEDKSLSHSNPLAGAVYHLVTASSLPEPSCSCPICARTSWIFLVLVAKEVPIILWGGSYFASLCKKPIDRIHINITSEHIKYH